MASLPTEPSNLTGGLPQSHAVLETFGRPEWLGPETGHNTQCRTLPARTPRARQEAGNGEPLIVTARQPDFEPGFQAAPPKGRISEIRCHVQTLRHQQCLIDNAIHQERSALKSVFRRKSLIPLTL